jgi:hypothetical protein
VGSNTDRIAAIACILAFLTFSPTPAEAQRRLNLQFGLRVGIPLTDTFTSDTPRLSVLETVDRVPASVGPSFEAILYDRLLLQLDAIYKPFRGRDQSVNPPTGATFNFRAASFEFPVIADYLITRGKRRPYAGLGVVAAHLMNGTNESLVPGPNAPFEGQFFGRTQLPAYIANAGIQWDTSVIAIRPEVRYTTWTKGDGFQEVRRQWEISIGFSLHQKRPDSD